MLPETTRQRGKAVEEKVAVYLQKNDYQIVEKNYTYKHLEIDIIALSKMGVLVFIEVKYREKKASNGFSIYDSISYKKRKNIIRCATHYIANNSKYQALPCQYDVVFCYYHQKDFVIEHIKNAFIG